jgi:uncharacterized FAD-dependent dehydrogenase
MKNTDFDVIIIGAGTAGIMAGFELVKLNPGIKLLMIDSGYTIEKRICPIIDNKTDKCIHCKSCSIMNGFGGAGAFSDGKFNFTTQFGGWLAEYLDSKKVMELIEYVDSINMQFGATEKRYSTSSPEAKKLEKLALQNDLHLLAASVKHLGTEENYAILKRQYEYLSQKVEFLFNTTVESIEPD